MAVFIFFSKLQCLLIRVRWFRIWNQNFPITFRSRDIIWRAALYFWSLLINLTYRLVHFAFSYFSLLFTPIFYEWPISGWVGHLENRTPMFAASLSPAVSGDIIYFHTHNMADFWFKLYERNILHMIKMVNKSSIKPMHWIGSFESSSAHTIVRWDKKL